MFSIESILRNGKGYTYADYLTWDDSVRYELIDGAPYAMAGATQAHQEVLIALSFQISGSIFSEVSMVELKKINKDNYQECLDLQVSDTQKGFVASNEYSLAQAWVFYDTAYPFAIYAEDKMVGFVMMGYYPEKDIYDIWRFMIDEQYQNKGYGKAALQLSIEYLKNEFHVKEIFLSFEPNNTIAERLYSKAGFKRTGEIDDGEIVMRLILKNK